MTRLQLKRPLAFFDLETTGLTIGADRIIEISICKLSPDGTRTLLTRRCNPGIPIPDVIAALTGISDDDVKDAPDFKSQAEEIVSFLDNCDLAGFNSNKFDIPFLVEELHRVGVEFDVSDRKFIDVQNIFHKKEPRNLAAAYQFYCGKPLENAHSAEADIIATADILEAQLSRYDDLANDVVSLHDFTNMHNVVDLAGRMVHDANKIPVFNFGKHKGKPVAAVFDSEPSYYDWLMKGDFSHESKTAFTRIWELVKMKTGQLQDKFIVKDLKKK